MKPAAWLKNYNDAHISERALAWADSFVGEKEQGHNAGPFVTMLLKAVSLPAGNAWCAAFISFCLRKAGFNGGPIGFGRARVKAWADWAFENDLIRNNPRRGDLFFWINKNGTGHIGFVLSSRDDLGRFRTLEGNTNPKGSREGDGVYKRDRGGATIRFIRWYA